MERNRTFSPESIHIRGMLDQGIWCVLRATLIPTHVAKLDFQRRVCDGKSTGESTFQDGVCTGQDTRSSSQDWLPSQNEAAGV